MITKRIFKNTLMLYVRQFLLLAVNLYMVRVVLDVLGVNDFGIYNVVAGIVTFCSFLSGGMASATQRYFSYALGKNDQSLLSTTYSLTLVIYFAIGIFVLLFLGTIGLFYVEEHLNLPVDRVTSAVYLYKFTVATLLITIATTPFLSIIISHEDMRYFAVISVAESITKLVAVASLVSLSGDKLELYGVVLFAVSLFTFLAYFFICLMKYEECRRLNFSFDKALLKQMSSFTGWTMFGQFSTAVRVQAVTILVNQYFNPSTVAARAIAITIASKVNIFATNFNTGLYPSIIKNYANGYEEEFRSLVFNGSKLTFFLMWVFAFPLLIEMDTILNIWLPHNPEPAVLFSRLALLESIIFSISLPLATAARAPGKMRNYELILGSMQVSIFLISYLLMELGFQAYSVFIVAIIINIVMFFTRLYIVSGLVPISINSFMSNVILPILKIIVTNVLLLITIGYFLPEGILWSVVTVFLCILSSSISMYYFGLSKDWRKKVKYYLVKKICN
ncbi:hypothetical protein [Vibrio campbellii]|uniref:hypothetical protein n=1 Tax=Vibrio campbellii TaxID=680 RepID=UPI000AAB614E|nr:hypothetical protein [Vibrio campbellii]